MTMSFHPDPATLMSFSSGTLPEASAAAVAVHLALCPRCRRQLRQLDRIGGALLGGLVGTQLHRALPELPPIAPTPPLVADPTASEASQPVAAPRPSAPPLDTEPPRDVAPSRDTVPPHDPNSPLLPAPLARLVGGASYDDIPWRRLAPGVWHLPLPLSKAATGDLRLLKVGAGLAMPEHAHTGPELTVVLQGTYTDTFGCFGPGDIADLDDGTSHGPVADARLGCVCLMAVESKVRYSGWLMRLAQPLFGLY